ncbi:Abc transporter c family member 5, partial [Globisporangium polare]
HPVPRRRVQLQGRRAGRAQGSLVRHQSQREDRHRGPHGRRQVQSHHGALPHQRAGLGSHRDRRRGHLEHAAAVAALAAVDHPAGARAVQGDAARVHGPVRRVLGRGDLVGVREGGDEGADQWFGGSAVVRAERERRELQRGRAADVLHGARALDADAHRGDGRGDGVDRPRDGEEAAGYDHARLCGCDGADDRASAGDGAGLGPHHGAERRSGGGVRHAAQLGEGPERS